MEISSSSFFHAFFVSINICVRLKYFIQLFIQLHVHVYAYIHTHTDLTCKRGSVGQSEGLFIPRSSVRFRLNPNNSNFHGFELHRHSIKGTKLLLKVINATIIIHTHMHAHKQLSIHTHMHAHYYPCV